MVKKLLLISFLIYIFINSSGCTSVISSYRSNKTLKTVGTYINSRQYEKAETTLIKAIQYHPQNIAAWVTLGDVYFTIEDYQDARYAYEEALRYDENAFDAYAGLWKVRLEEAGYTEEIKREVRKEIEDMISSGEKGPERLWAVFSGLGYLHEDDKAFEIAQEIVASEPDKEAISSLSTYISEESLRDKDVERRLRLTEDFLRLFPLARERYLVYSIRLNTAAKELKDKDLLYKYGEDWLRDEPDSRRANFYVGYKYIEEGIALEEAIYYIKKALRLIEDPDPADKPEYYPDSEWHKDIQRSKGIYYDALGQGYYKLGRLKEAEDAYRMGVRYLDFDEKLYFHLGQLLEEKGDMEGAIDAYVQALKSGENKDVEERLRTLVSTDKPLYQFFAKKEGVTTFTDVTEEAGLSGVSASRVAWGDYNNDGHEDILLNGAVLLKNNGNGTFTNVTTEAGIVNTSGANGGVWGDFNNDGYLDFYTLASGKGTTDRFWKNNGDGTFTDITAMATGEHGPFRTEAAAWGDYDNDGFIDLYIANYERPLSESVDRARCWPDHLFHNNGNETFTDVSDSAGIVSLENMCGRGVNWGDYDNDGDPDIYVANYRLDPNFLWRNNGDGTFTNVANEAGVEGSEEEGAYGHSIGAEWGDINNDGYLDLFVSNLAHPRYIGLSDKSMLLVNQGPPEFRFVNRFGDSGIRFEETSADPSLADYDNDGILDLFFTSTYEGKKSFLYKGNGDGTFTDVTWLAGVRVDNGWGNAFADYDNDGDLDLLVASGNGVRLFRNDGNNNHWLHVRVVGKGSNRAGIGARVTVGRQIREVQGGKGSGSQHSLPVEFGLGSYSGPVDVAVRFPSGKVVRLDQVNPDQMIAVADE